MGLGSVHGPVTTAVGNAVPFRRRCIARLAHAADGHPGAAFNLAEGVVKEPAAMKRYSKLILRNAEDLTSMCWRRKRYGCAAVMQRCNRYAN